jgi:hypothetical protein
VAQKDDPVGQNTHLVAPATSSFELNLRVNLASEIVESEKDSQIKDNSWYIIMPIAIKHVLKEKEFVPQAE